MKRQGIFDILDSTCKGPRKTDEVFTQTMLQVHGKSKALRQVSRAPASTGRRGSQFERINGFAIKHYAGEVTYDAKGFVVKNTDSTHPDTTNLFTASACDITASLLTLGAAGSVGRRSSKKEKSFQFISTSTVFSHQLESLMKTLDATAPYFVRCIKPNEDKKAFYLVNEYVRPQMRCGGLVEALRIIKCGYPTRCSYERIFNKFGYDNLTHAQCFDRDSSRAFTFLRSICDRMTGRPDKMKFPNINKRDFTEGIINVCGSDAKFDKTTYQLGLTMIFFKPGKQAFFTRILERKADDFSSAEVRLPVLGYSLVVSLCGAFLHFRSIKSNTS